MSRMGAFEKAFAKVDNTMLINQELLAFGWFQKDPEDPDCASPEDMAESLASLRLAALAMDALAPRLSVASDGHGGHWLKTDGFLAGRLDPGEAEAIEAALDEARKGR